MPTLTEDVILRQGLLSVDTPTDMVLDGVYQIDSEYVQVKARPRAGGKVQVSRGVFGSTVTTHESGANVTAVRLVAQTSAVSAPPTSRVQQVRLLGPFTLNFDTPGLIMPNNYGINLGDELREGSIVFSAWLTATGTEFSGPTAPYLQVGIGEADDDITTVAYFDLGSGAAGSYPFSADQGFPEGYVAPQLVYDSGLYLVAAIYFDSGSFIEGTGDLYVLVAENA